MGTAVEGDLHCQTRARHGCIRFRRLRLPLPAGETKAISGQWSSRLCLCRELCASSRRAAAGMCTSTLAALGQQMQRAACHVGGRRV